LNQVGHTFLPGHRLRLSVSSSAYPWVHPNPNTGEPIATDTSPPRPALQRVFRDAARPSRLVLPVLPAP
jgi:predicted acyl esterase